MKGRVFTLDWIPTAISINLNSSLQDNKYTFLKEEKFLFESTGTMG